MAIELLDRMAILVAVPLFPGTDVANSHSLRYDSNVRMWNFFKLLMLFFGAFWVGVRR
jgi:hypothetical protein